MRGFEVLSAGALTLIQDIGRFSYAHLGITNSGALDEESYCYANMILNNPFNTNALEITFSGLKLLSHKNTVICITGATFDIKINNTISKMYKTLTIKKGDIIELNNKQQGQRAYLSIKGGFNIKKELNSHSLTLKEKIGGLNGEKLKKGDILPFKEQTILNPQSLALKFQPQYNKTLKLRIILGYQNEHFSEKTINTFFNTIFQTTNDMNRMGIKLKSPTPIKCNINGIISEGIAYGGVQIMPDGNITILLKDRQTIGGYPKIGSVLPIDCFKLAQAQALCDIRFEIISLDKARKKMQEFYLFFDK